MSINDGGPAFPQDDWSVDAQKYLSSGGMTLRDYFAAHAPNPPQDMALQEHCAYRYRYADAMLRAREPS